MGAHDTSTEQETSPWDVQGKYLEDIFAKAKGMYDTNAGPQLYKGNWTAGFDPAETSAQNSLLNYSQGAGKDFTQNVLGASNFGLNAMDSKNNPYLQGYINAAVDPIYRNLQENTLGATRTDANLAGAYGGSRQGIAEGLATQGAQREAGNVGTNIAQGAYNKGLDTYTQTLAMAPQLFQLGAAPDIMQGQVGEMRRGMSQAGIDQTRQTYEYEQMLPYLMLQQYLSMVSGDYGAKGDSQYIDQFGKFGSMFENFFPWMKSGDKSSSPWSM